MPETENKPRLSVVICTFNRADYLKQCLEGLTRQSFDDFEVIIVDADSNDQTPQVIANYSPKLRIRKINEPEKELAKARDEGWRAARGDLVAWIDDDVVVSQGWAEAVVRTLDENADIGGVSGPTIVPEDLLKNRDVFFFYNKAGITKLLGDFWNNFFLEGGINEVGRIFKSGAWSPGSNFPQSLEIQGLKEVDYLEACNMTLRRELVERVRGFDLGYRRVSEWSEIDLAMRIRALGHRLVFNSRARVDHNISQAGIYAKRTRARQRMENFLKFYFRHIFKPRPDYFLKFSAYVLFLNFYWTFKAASTQNPDWLGGWVGTITGLRFFSLNQK